jgi:hypothetical protein
MALLEDEWLIAAHDRVPSHDGGSMWFMLAIGCGLCEIGRGQLKGCGDY